MALEQDAQSILPEYVEDDAETRLQKLAVLVSIAIEATSLLISWEIWPDHRGQEPSLSGLTEIAKCTENHFKVWKLSSAFEGARESLAMMKANYPTMDVRAALKSQYAIDL